MIFLKTFEIKKEKKNTKTILNLVFIKYRLFIVILWFFYLFLGEVSFFAAGDDVSSSVFLLF